MNYKGFDILSRVNGFDLFRNGEFHCTATTIDEAKIYADAYEIRHRISEPELAPGDVYDKIKNGKDLFEVMTEAGMPTPNFAKGGVDEKQEQELVLPRVRDMETGIEVGKQSQDKRVKELEGLVEKFASLNEHHENFKCIAGHILKAREILQS